MDAKEAADAANAIGAKVTIPMHYKMQSGGNGKELEEESKRLVTESQVKIFEELK